MTDREMDATVAEMVMGWEFYGRRDWIADAIRSGGKVVRASGGWTISPTGDVWSPTTDPAADYSVLVRVRETWGEFEVGIFASNLDDLWENRGDDNPVWPDLCLPLKYRPGDYSRAALAALSALPPTERPTR